MTSLESCWLLPPRFCAQPLTINHLWYSGEMDDGQESGKGAWYYNNGQVMYEGEFKKGKQSGKGSYYDENGNLIYSGEWENGDYAH